MEYIFFPNVCFWLHYKKLVVTRNLDLCLVFISIPLIGMSVFEPIPFSSYNFSSVVQLEIRDSGQIQLMQLKIILLLFRTGLGILCLCISIWAEKFLFKRIFKLHTIQKPSFWEDWITLQRFPITSPCRVLHKNRNKGS